MAKKILILCGSPRVKGNTNTVVEWVAESATAAGAAVKTVNVAPLKFAANGCICCMGCQKSDRYECVIKDAAQPILASMPDFNAVVFATPIYFFGPSAQLKLVLDRMYSLYKFKDGEESFGCAIRNVTLGLIATAADGPEGGLAATEDMFRAIASFNGGGFTSLLVPHAPRDPKQLVDNQAVRQQAMDFGRQLAAE